MNRRNMLVALVGFLTPFVSYRLFLRPKSQLRAALKEGLRDCGIEAEGSERFLSALSVIPEEVRGQLLPWYGYGSSLKESLVRGFLLSSIVSETNGTRYASFRALADPYSHPCVRGF